VRGLWQVIHVEKTSHSNVTLCGVQSVSDDRLTADVSAVTCSRCLKLLAKAVRS
jgi:hypothetical protein